MNEKIRRMVSRNQHCVISTVGTDGNPQAALVGFSINNELEIMIGTNDYTRKYKNILENPNVAIVISLEEDKLSLQYEGKAERLEGEELLKRVKIHYKNDPVAMQRLKDPTQVFLKISPLWIRLVDANFKPIHFEERQFV